MPPMNHVAFRIRRRVTGLDINSLLLDNAVEDDIEDDVERM